MTMRFKYTSVSNSQPVVSLGGRLVRPWPMLMVSVIGPSNTIPVHAKIDTACDETLFSEDLALKIGIDLKNAPVERAFTANQSLMTVRYAHVALRLTDGIEYREWRAWAEFVAGLRRPILGFGGFLRFFTATFYGDEEAFGLTVNRLYPGT